MLYLIVQVWAEWGFSNATLDGLEELGHVVYRYGGSRASFVTAVYQDEFGMLWGETDIETPAGY